MYKEFDFDFSNGSEPSRQWIIRFQAVPHACGAANSVPAERRKALLNERRLCRVNAPVSWSSYWVERACQAYMDRELFEPTIYVGSYNWIYYEEWERI